jgi:hypothetical protein
MSPFARIEALAAKRKGGAAALAKLLPKPRSRGALAKTPDEFFLSALAKQVFRAGFVWQIVEHKWPSMEEAFGGFRPELVAALEERDVDDLLADPLTAASEASSAAGQQKTSSACGPRCDGKAAASAA